MNISDILYGEHTVDEPVVADLLASPAVVRLGGVDQGGYMRVHFAGAEHTRLEHSIGVFLLLRSFGASLEEQVAGLLHDVSHTVFSHCADYAFAKGSEKRQDFQDNNHRGYVLESDIPVILARHGFDVERILDERIFPLLETELPDICADRIDYMLRMAVLGKAATVDEARQLLKTLAVSDQAWIFNGHENARRFAELFAFVNHTHMSGFISAVMLRTVGDALARAVDLGVVSRQDLFSTDDYVLSLMRDAARQDETMNMLWRRMNREVPVLPDFSQCPETTAYLKSRMVDPLFKNAGGRAARLSSIEPEWGQRVARESKPKIYGLRFP
jgi:hypothetical protein